MSETPEPKPPRIEPTQWPGNFDVHGSVRLGWMYPGMYSGEARDRIEITLYSVRAADSISIEYDGPRDGWVIRMDRTRDDDGITETVEEKVEVAFIPAWNQSPHDPVSPLPPIQP